MTQARHRVKISATVDPSLLREIDAYIGSHPNTDRSSVIDEALALWLAKQQDRDMLTQFEGDDAPEGERHQWQAVQRHAAAWMLRRDT